MSVLKVRHNGEWIKVAGGGSASGGIDLPSGGTPGQVLTMGEDGNPMWTNAIGDTLPAAEEVGF